ncbi:hypothetical protein POV27_10000 [Aureisphaera galaxeae]|uniref:hypothetical protein n=1 Tax=Aureisphaera galaxeae TaxID=1538023 RepID=UPI0023508075|nr:hypothetical protein [Aureisphaera galaxeae]MDC8004385.1 hypothetical protein [Aureisphaera galaxeae]
MDQLTEFVNQLPDYLGVFLLMLSTFLIGYFSAWYMQKSKYLKALRKINKTSERTKRVRDEKDIDVIFTEIKPKIIEVVKETQEELQSEIEEAEEEEIPTALPAEDIAEKARTSYITYTLNKPKLNFDNFGHAEVSDKQDLTQINGIGPYIEQKLNEIGIYNYEQISRFKDEDIRVLTELIDFFPGRIERDDWVGQAESLKD